MRVWTLAMASLRALSEPPSRAVIVECCLSMSSLHPVSFWIRRMVSPPLPMTTGMMRSSMSTETPSLEASHSMTHATTASLAVATFSSLPVILIVPECNLLMRSILTWLSDENFLIPDPPLPMNAAMADSGISVKMHSLRAWSTISSTAALPLCTASSVSPDITTVASSFMMSNLQLLSCSSFRIVAPPLPTMIERSQVSAVSNLTKRFSFLASTSIPSKSWSAPPLQAGSSDLIRMQFISRSSETQAPSSLAMFASCSGLLIGL